MRLYVGNLAFNTTENDLQDNFERYGTVADVKIMMDQGSGRSRGFGFVTMGSSAEGQAAITGLDGQDMDGRNLTVNEARPREERGGGGGGGGFGGGAPRSGGKPKSFSGGGGGGGGRRY
jgi:cold-inducible RNA-binding protein